MDIKDRLRKLLDLYGIKQADFCRKLRVSNGYISAMRDGISFEKLSLIARYYPEIDLRALLLGWVEPEDHAPYQRSGKRIWRYESCLDINELYEDRETISKLRREVESLKQTIQKQEKIITRLKNKKQKAKD